MSECGKKAWGYTGHKLSASFLRQRKKGKEVKGWKGQEGITRMERVLSLCAVGLPLAPLTRTGWTTRVYVRND
jgi:hypothetical protein